jgi:hypothetical protein
MRPQIYWVDLPIIGRLAVMPRPSAGDWLDEEVSGLRSEDVDIVVSLLEAEEVNEIGLREEERLCRSYGIEYISFPILDRGVPDSEQKAAALAQTLAARLGEGNAVVIHCRAGIGRSSLIAACILVCSRFDPEIAFDAISKARGLPVPDTDDQRNWVMAFRERFGL